MDNNETVKVLLGDRSYNIFIGRNIVKKTNSQLKALFSRNKVVVITDKNVFENQYENLMSQLGSLGLAIELFVIEPGEKSKSWDTLQKILEWLIKKEIGKKDYILAFGGGVIGDLVGLAASLLRRGVNLVQIPTTLLSQVDSSIGGKTAINSSEAKNVIGSFYQPKIVLCDIGFLKTLDNRQYLSGYAEILKMAMVFDRKFFLYLEENWRQIFEQREEQLINVLKASLCLKAKVVEQDEHENGERALLNFGHTFGHALESYFGYSEKLLHGEAVALGMVLATQFSVNSKVLPNDSRERLVEHCKKVGLPVHINQINNESIRSEKIIDFIKQDKKVVGENINLILLKDIGKGYIEKGVSFQLIKKFLSEIIS